MKHYKDPTTNEIYAYEADGSQDSYIKQNLVPISDEELAALRASLVNPNDVVLSQIFALEQSVTQRRIREAVLGTDGGWLSDLNNDIASLRASLT